MDVEARTGYEASKLARERYAEYFHNFHGMSLAGVRFFSVYQGFGGAEEHKGEYANTVAQFTHKIASGERPELFGDGTQTRDFTHVDDIVRACELAADNELQGIYNVGTAESYSFNTMVEMINDELGTEIEPTYIENPSKCTSTTRWPTTRNSMKQRVGSRQSTLRRVSRGSVSPTSSPD